MYSIYRMILRQYNHSVDLDPQIKLSIASHSGEFTFPTSHDESKSMYKAALQELRTAEQKERNDSKLKDKFLQTKADAHALHGDQSTSKYLKLLKQCKESARVYKKVAHARGKSNHGGFTTIEVPMDPTVHSKQATHWRTVECPQEIEDLLLEQNQKHFDQAEGTP